MEPNLAYQDELYEELIDGNVILMSPRPTVNHNFVSGNIYRIFSNYLHGKSCVPFADGTDLYLTDTDRFIPDGMIVCDRDKIQMDGVHGAPDLVIEVLSPSTARYDRGHKKDIYERCGVREYWIVSPTDKSVEQYILENGRFILRDIYMVYSDVLLEKMKPEERAQIQTTFSCSLFDDLIISLDDVFARVF